MIKNCIMCKNWWFDPGTPDYSEYTPGDDWESKCTIDGGWRVSGGSVSESDWREKIKTAETCEHFVEVKDG